MYWSRIFAAVSRNAPGVTLTLGVLAAGCLWACSPPRVAPSASPTEAHEHEHAHAHAVMRASVSSSQVTQVAPPTAPSRGAAALYRETLELRAASARLKKEVEALEDREPSFRQRLPNAAASRETDQDRVRVAPAP